MGRARRLCGDWQARVATMARNLTEFADAPEAIAVRARLLDPAHPYEGRTLAEASAATQALASLWQDYLLVLAVIEEAENKARRPGLFNRDDEVLALLEGASIRLPALSVPILRRGLLDPADAGSLATPGEVVASMTRAFETARDALRAIADAERDGDAEAAALAAALDTLEPRARARAALAGASCDPLGRRDGLGQAGRDVAAVARAVRDRDVAVARVGERLATETARLGTLRDTVGAVAAAMDERRARIADDPPPAQGVAGPLARTLPLLRLDPGDVAAGDLVGAAAVIDPVCRGDHATARRFHTLIATMDPADASAAFGAARSALKAADTPATRDAAMAALARVPPSSSMFAIARLTLAEVALGRSDLGWPHLKQAAEALAEAGSGARVAATRAALLEASAGLLKRGVPAPPGDIAGVATTEAQLGRGAEAACLAAARLAASAAEKSAYVDRAHAARPVTLL